MSRRRHVRTLVPLVGVVAGMAAMAWAAVPLYDLFCRVTGFGGTPLVAEAGADRVLDRTVNVRFDASTAAGMPWEFRPEKTARTVRIGETALAFYEAANPTDRPVTGTATFNVTPHLAGVYFRKIACFCFSEQRLDAGESVDMPVSFFVDPDIEKDPNLRGLKTITLSYTFFRQKGDESADRITARVPAPGAAPAPN